MPKLSPYAKAVWAFLSTVVGGLLTAVHSVPTHSLRDVGTEGWLIYAAFVLATTGGVYGFTNVPAVRPVPNLSHPEG